MCHVRLSKGPPKHSTVLFSSVGLKEDLPGRLSQLLLVPFAGGSDLLPFIRIESIERKLHNH